MNAYQPYLLGGLALLLLVTFVAAYIRSRSDRNYYGNWTGIKNVGHYFGYRLKRWVVGLIAALALVFFFEKITANTVGTIAAVMLLFCVLFFPIWAAGMRNSEFDD